MPSQFEELRQDYQAAKNNRFRRRRTGIATGGASADWHYRSEADYLKLIEYARDADRNDQLIGQMVDRAVGNTIQGGMTYNPDTGDEEVDQLLKSKWEEWSSDPEQCDIMGEMDFSQMEHLAYRATLVDGDILPTLYEAGYLQLVEAHRLRTPTNTSKNVIHGVLVDENRRRLQYWFTKDDVDPRRAVSRVADVQKVNARDETGMRQVLHVYNPRRVTQTRGVTALAPIFTTATQLEDIQFAKLVQQQVVSCFAILKEREAGGSADAWETPGTATYGDQTSEMTANGSVRTVEGVSPGMEYTGFPGETLKAFSPNVPNAEFFEHVKLTISIISVNLGLPLGIAMLDPAQSNFSSWRGAVEQARQGFKHNQQWFTRKFHRPIFEWKLAQWIVDDPVIAAAHKRLGKELFKHKWNTPSWPYIDPLKDAQADLVRLSNNLISRRRWASERNMDWQDVSREIVEDHAFAYSAARDMARTLNEQAEDDEERITWRDLLSLPLPNGFRANINLDRENDDGQQQDS